MDFIREKFKGYEIVTTNDSSMPNGGIFVPDFINNLMYLHKDGIFKVGCGGGGWFDTVEHAKKVICKYLGVPYGPIIGGE